MAITKFSNLPINLIPHGKPVMSLGCNWLSVVHKIDHPTTLYTFQIVGCTLMDLPLVAIPLGLGPPFSNFPCFRGFTSFF